MLKNKQKENLIKKYGLCTYKNIKNNKYIHNFKFFDLNINNLSKWDLNMEFDLYCVKCNFKYVDIICNQNDKLFVIILKYGVKKAFNNKCKESKQYIKGINMYLYNECKVNYNEYLQKNYLSVKV